MEKKLKNTKAYELGEFAYRIESPEIVTDKEMRRQGTIIIQDGKVITIPNKKSDGKQCKAPHKIRESEHGKLTLSRKLKRVTVTISFDRESDSPEAIMAECEELTKDYLVDVLKYELDFVNS